MTPTQSHSSTPLPRCPVLDSTETADTQAVEAAPAPAPARKTTRSLVVFAKMRAALARNGMPCSNNPARITMPRGDVPPGTYILLDNQCIIRCPLVPAAEVHTMTEVEMDQWACACEDVTELIRTAKGDRRIVSLIEHVSKNGNRSTGKAVRLSPAEEERKQRRLAEARLALAEARIKELTSALNDRAQVVHVPVAGAVRVVRDEHCQLPDDAGERIVYVDRFVDRPVEVEKLVEVEVEKIVEVEKLVYVDRPTIVEVEKMVAGEVAEIPEHLKHAYKGLSAIALYLGIANTTPTSLATSILAIIHGQQVERAKRNLDSALALLAD